MADMDGSANVPSDADSNSTNHDGGNNILYFDGHVSWQTTNYASNDKFDNIFSQNRNMSSTVAGWSADTDCMIDRNKLVDGRHWFYSDRYNDAPDP